MTFRKPGLFMLVSLLMITACASPLLAAPVATEANTPLPAAPIRPNDIPSAVPTLPTPTFKPLPTPFPIIPTFTPLPPQPVRTLFSIPESALTFDQGANAYRIQFPSNATRVDIGGHMGPEGEKRYVLSAMQGQIMAVWMQAVKGGGYFEVMSADSKMLSRQRCPSCSINDEYLDFWRGALPATQDYVFTVKLTAGQDFRLYVAIAPLGEKSQSFDYRDEQNGFALSSVRSFL